jgi:hypothetical protein
MPIIRNPSNCRCSLWFPYECVGRCVLSRGRSVSKNMHRALICPSSGACQTAVAASGFRMNVEVDVFSAVVGLLVTVPETYWAVSVQQSNKALRFIVASSCVFCLIDRRCTEPQTLNPIVIRLVSLFILTSMCSIGRTNRPASLL